MKLLEAQRKHRRKRVTARRCGDGKRAEESSHGGINAPPSDPSSASTGKGTRARGLPLFASITRYHHQEVGRPSPSPAPQLQFGVVAAGEGRTETISTCG